eukprot:2034824-Alexandrium_andersonii.AAC.1
MREQVLEPLRAGYRLPEPPSWRLQRERPFQWGHRPPGPPQKAPPARAGGAFFGGGVRGERVGV